MQRANPSLASQLARCGQSSVRLLPSALVLPLPFALMMLATNMPTPNPAGLQLFYSTVLHCLAAALVLAPACLAMITLLATLASSKLQGAERVLTQFLRIHM